MMQLRKKRFIVMMLALVWEISRIGILWQANRNIISVLFDTLNPYYLIWLIAPAVVVVTGYLIYLFDRESYQLGMLLFMSRCFYVLFGLIGVATILYTRYQVPFAVHEFFMILSVIVFDIIFGVLQYLITTRRES